ncbi:MAG: 3-phosphoshikimate 1-carboxyvinyltransferase [Flavobacteriales bacterium]|nr:3-phosphoshikimate 1-carboxyvinyltransferase [Flavobacteriales bacterium]
MRGVTIRRPEGPIRAAIELPRSKSVSNRALIAAALAGDIGGIEHLSDADDTRILHHLLRDKPRVMHCGLGGTTFRFLLAWAAVQRGSTHVITGDSKLLERPHDELIDALRRLGASIERTEEGYSVKGVRLDGGAVHFESPISSQYLSALMLVAPGMDKGLRIEWHGMQLSRPYVEMTARVMRHFGAEVEVGDTLIEVRPGRYVARPFDVPCDWSAAAFWYEIMALAEDAEVELVGLNKDGAQGDVAVAALLGNLVTTDATERGLLLRRFLPGVPNGIAPVIDLQATPDLFQPLAFTLAALGLPTAFTGLHNLGRKETDRIAAVAGTLAMMDVRVRQSEGALSIAGCCDVREVAWAVHGDHRMAMALAPLALVAGRITLQDPDVVTKSYPAFWEDLRKAGFGVDLV